MKTICRFCGQPLKHTFCDLGLSPVSNSYLSQEQLEKKEQVFPLHAYICDNCFLVQLEEFQSPKEIFNDYAYFSSYSTSWLKHCEEYVEMMVKRFQLNSSHQVIEIASNDGYLLQYYKNRGIPILGIEPAENVARKAKEKGIPTVVDFFGTKVAHELKQNNLQADVLCGNNVLAHVPMLNDFVQGMKILLKPHGIITMEFPHLHRLMESNQFDTIYHEHFSYFSFLTVRKIFKKHGLTIWDVAQLKTHGGSLRIFASHSETHPQETLAATSLEEFEIKMGYNKLETYLSFSEKIDTIKDQLTHFFLNAQKSGKKVVAYGAPAKGNTLLNFCQIKKEFLPYTVDKNPHKQGKYLPGTKIPIYSPDKIKETKPDYLLILPWNLKDEIMDQMQEIRSWGGKFVIPIPELEEI